MALARPRGEYSHIRPKLHKCVARPRPLLGAPARPRDGLGASAPQHLVFSDQLLEGSRARAPLTVHPREPTKTRFGPPFVWRARATTPAPKNRVPPLFLSFFSHFLFSPPNLSTPNLSLSHTKHSYINFVMDRKRKSEGAIGKGKLAMPPTRKSSRLAGLPPFVQPTSPKSVLRPNKLLVLAIAADVVEIHHKARGTAQAPIEKPPTNIKGKKTARIFVKPLRKWFSQRIIARGGPSRLKPKKAVVIDLVSDEVEDTQEKEAAMEQPPMVANQEESEDEEEDPNYEEKVEEEDPEESVELEETPSSYSLLSPFPATPELAPGEYDDPDNWNFDGDIDQWGTDVAGGEPTAAQD
ncbi:hypothetical protein PIB30_054345 [Stylosanthes scabra]|uniref:Uncharacterized protein n=1 Tax=Stylosanthes scabra TaxID=79078 RepID=A0ABU6YKL6_9FABA|nr:hypothetical protein [Stylosanthes scabra]